jgi:hypothetical protein
MRRATLVLGAVLAGAAWSPSAAGAVDRVYVADADFHGRIAFAALDASGAGQLDISGATANMPYGVAIDSAAGRIYWAGAGGRSRSRTSTEAAAAATLTQRARPSTSRRARRSTRSRAGSTGPTSSPTRRRCTRYARLAGGFTRPGVAGNNRFLLTGWLSARRLVADSYRLIATPSANRQRGDAKRARFRVKG